MSWLVRRYVTSRTDVTLKEREQYERAIPQPRPGLEAVRLDRLDRQDVARWLDDLAGAGQAVVSIGADLSYGAARRAGRRPVEEGSSRGSPRRDRPLLASLHTAPRSLDRALASLVERAGLPRLTSHGLRHTAATHMVRAARSHGELRAAADVLGHSPDMLMKTYAHALPDSTRAVAELVGARTNSPGGSPA